MAEQAASLLGFMAHDIPILVKEGLLRPLGNPPGNAVKYFAASEIVQHADDQNWLSRATKALYAHWKSANASRRGKPRAIKTDTLLAA
jgi:hypothetical protein